jgi:GT2 family glycosyltransferase
MSLASCHEGADYLVIRILPDMSIVIPTVGRDLLEGCLQSIIGGNAWPARLIVVEQGSNPAVAAWISGLEARGLTTEHVTSRERGVAAGRNRGIERVRTRFVAVTDDDCRVAPDWLERMAVRLRQNPDAFVTGRVEGLGVGNGVASPSLMESPIPEVHTHPLLKRDPLYGNNMGFAIATAERVGPLDERDCVLFAEEAEWSYRALRAGVPVVYAPDVIVKHLAWRNAAELALTYRRYARSQGGFYGTYLRRGDPFIVARALFDLARAPWLVLRGAATRNRELIAVGRAYLTELPAGILTGLTTAEHKTSAR